MNPLRVAWFSPLNIEGAKLKIYEQQSDSIASSSSAYVSDILLPLLKNDFEIEVFHEGFESYQDFPTFHYLKAFERHAAKPFDLFFYQLEDRECCNFIRMHLGLMPGVVFFHDLLFTKDGPEPILNSPWTDVISCFKNHCSGSKVAWPDRTKKFERQGPIAYREAGLSLLSLFSSERDYGEYTRQIEHGLSKSLLEAGVKNTVEASYVPFPVDPALALKPKSDSSKLRIGFCGSTKIEHRSHKLLEALSKTEVDYKLIWMIDSDEENLALDLLGEFGIESYEFLVFRTPSAWQELVTSLDLAVHTQFSAFGQPGPYLAMSLMAGLPVAVTRFGTTDVLPASVVFHIEAGETESSQIIELLERLSDGSKTSSLQTTRDYAAEIFDCQAVASELSSMFLKSRQYFQESLGAWDNFQFKARKSLLNEVSELYLRGSNLDSRVLSEGSEHFAKTVLKPIFRTLNWDTLDRNQ